MLWVDISGLLKKKLVVDSILHGDEEILGSWQFLKAG
jgi:hypothetical protein